jgi:hypothetical protein
VTHFLLLNYIDLSYNFSNDLIDLYSRIYLYEYTYKITYTNIKLCIKCTPLLDHIFLVLESTTSSKNLFFISSYTTDYIASCYNNNYEMMFNFLTTFKFHRFCQSGLYFDYFFKKITEVFIRNFLIYTAQFFGEKFMIEY